MKELLRERSLWIAILLSTLGIAAGIPFYQMKYPLVTGCFLDYFQKALSSQLLLFLIPVAAVLPLGASYVRESSTGFLKMYLTRMDRMSYIRRKTAQIYAAGFLTFFLAGMVIFLLGFLFLYPLELQGKFPVETLRADFLLLLRISLVGGMFSELSGIFGAAFLNYYMAYGLPFVSFYMLIILKERYFGKMYALYPAEWIKCEQDWGTYKIGIWIFLGVFSVVFMLLHGLVLYERLREV